MRPAELAVGVGGSSRSASRKEDGGDAITPCGWLGGRFLQTEDTTLEGCIEKTVQGDCGSGGKSGLSDNQRVGCSNPAPA